MNTKTLNRFNDALIKYVFAREERKGVTLSLINAVLAAQDLPLLVDLQFQDREIDGDDPEDKESRLDIHARSSDGAIVNVEVQATSLASMGKRALFYWSRLYSLKRGEAYWRLPRTISINILDFELFPELPGDFLNTYAVLNTKHSTHRLTDDLEIHFLEVPKFAERVLDVNALDAIGRWMAYFSKATSEKDLQAIAGEEPMIQEALKAERIFAQTPDLISAYDMAEKARLDRLAREQFVREEGLVMGRAEGEAKGRAEERSEIALKLLSLQMPVSQIAEVTGLSADEIRKIQCTRPNTPICP